VVCIQMVFAVGFTAGADLLDSPDPSSEEALRELLETQLEDESQQQEADAKRPTLSKEQPVPKRVKTEQNEYIAMDAAREKMIAMAERERKLKAMKKGRSL